jgi:hypothetical protein
MTARPTLPPLVERFFTERLEHFPIMLHNRSF